MRDEQLATLRSGAAPLTARQGPAGGAPALDAARGERRVRVPAGGSVTLEGTLAGPREARGIVLFAHGSGSGRMSPRNRFVASVLQDAGFATLLIDLLTPEEDAVDERTHTLRFDVDLLADRLAGVTDWLANNPATHDLAIGYFGASTGAAAALVAASRRPDDVRAIVSRGGRPDLAESWLGRVRAPVLLVVGGEDEDGEEVNRDAFDRLRVDKELVVVAGASHRFEEPGALDEVARLATDWFARHVAP